MVDGAPSTSSWVPSWAWSNSAEPGSRSEGPPPVQVAVIDVRRGQREGEEADKILGYYPPSLDVDKQCARVGLMIAMVQFTSTFQPERPCNIITTERERWAMHNCEEGLWILLVVARAWHHPHAVRDATLLRLVRNLHALLRLQHGSIQRLLFQDPSAAAAREVLKRQLADTGAALGGASGSGLAELLGPLTLAEGVPFVRPAPKTALSVQCLMDSLLLSTHNGLRPIEGCMLCAGGYAVWSSLPREDTAALAHVAAHTLAHVPRRSSKGSGSGAPVVEGGWLRSEAWEECRDGYLRLAGGSGWPAVFLRAGSERCRLVPLRHGGLLLLLLLGDGAGDGDDALQECVSGCSDMVGAVAELLAEELPMLSAWHVKGTRYLYLDGLLGAAMATPSAKAVKAMSRDSATLLTAMRQQADWYLDDPSTQWGPELYVHGTHDAWLCVRQAGPRSLCCVMESLGEDTLAGAGAAVDAFVARRCPNM